MANILTLIGVASTSELGILSSASKVIQQMAVTYEQISFGQKRCKDIIQRAALIVKELRASTRNDPASMHNITKLQTKFEEVEAILQKLAGMSFFKALLHYKDIDKDIERANRHIADCSQLFLMPGIPSHWHAQAQTTAAKSDRDALRSLLKLLAGNYEEIRRRFGIYSDDQEDQAMTAMERELRNTKFIVEEDTPVEVQIMQRSLECIKATTGKRVPKQKKWMITERDLDILGTIGGGGFSTVRKARYRGMMVAVKTLKYTGYMGEAMEREVEIWSELRHDHIVPFYGASTSTSSPFIVSRYMQNGNLVQYLIRTPDVDRTKLMFQVSLGMYYLHEEYVIHGDLKGVNVLVDDSGKACITDFGLSKVCASGTPGTKTGVIAGTLRFLAPEALGGEPLSFETDVYAFGMLIYEVFTGEVPFIREPDHLVEEGRVRLQRPTSNLVHQRGFNDVLWQLLSKCISSEPSARPGFKPIQEFLGSIQKAEPSVEPVSPGSMLGTEDKSPTDWGLPAVNPSSTRSHKSIARSISQDIKTPPSISPMCIVVTHKYFDVPFGISSQEPAVYLEKGDMVQWQPLRANKRSLLHNQNNRFWYRSGAGNGSNSWELNGNDVTLRTASSNGVCHFRDAQTAQGWFRLQMNYAHDGSVGDWGMAMGDLFYTERSWRRLSRGKIQQADVAEGDPYMVPNDHSWIDTTLPKRGTVDHQAGTDNCIICITNPGKQPGRLCFKLEGCIIVVETYRRLNDKDAVGAREETYPTEEYAEMTFRILKSMLEKASEKNSRSSFLSSLRSGT